jgi:hypothetical protein
MNKTVKIKNTKRGTIPLKKRARPAKPSEQDAFFDILVYTKRIEN